MPETKFEATTICLQQNIFGEELKLRISTHIEGHKLLGLVSNLNNVLN